MKKYSEEWVCTDSDAKQYGRQLTDKIFEFKEKMYLEEEEDDKVVEMIINLNKYTPKEVEKHISAYYESVEEIEEIYGDEADWIIAECIFEQESRLY